MRRAWIIVLVVLLATTVQASRIEEATGIKYQHDGGTPGDASDVCDRPDPPLSVGDDSVGITVPVDDHVDNYALSIPEELVGVPVTVSIASSPGLPQVPRPAPDHDLFIWSPDCGHLIDRSIGPPGEGDEVTFVPDGTGTYVVQVQADVDRPGGGPAPVGCHPHCERAGYSIHLDSG